ncbi:MAG: hypothetical protein AAB701_01225 [Patescibacteria group bacterium]
MDNIQRDAAGNLDLKARPKSPEGVTGLEQQAESPADQQPIAEELVQPLEHVVATPNVESIGDLPVQEPQVSQETGQPAIEVTGLLAEYEKPTSQLNLKALQDLVGR